MSIPEVKAPQGTPQAQGTTPAEQPKQPDAKEIVVFPALDAGTGGGFSGNVGAVTTTGAAVVSGTGAAVTTTTAATAYAGWEFAKQTTANLFGPTIAGAEAGVRHAVTDIGIPLFTGLGAGAEAAARQAVTDVAIPTAVTTYATVDAFTGGSLTALLTILGAQKVFGQNK